MIGILFSLILTSSSQDVWGYREVIDPITDAKRGIASIDGVGGAVLVFKCDSTGGSPYLHLISSEYLGGDGIRSEMRTLTYRVDQNPPVRQQWRHRDSDAVLSNQRDLLSILKEMLEGDRIHIRASRYDNRSVDMSFALDGAREAMTKVHEACTRR